MANAAGSKGERGEVKPSQQGRAGLRLQNALPDARIALRLGDRGHHRARPRLRAAARALGRRRDPVRDPHRLRLRHGGGRGRRDGGGRARPQGIGSLPGPRALLRRRRGRHPGALAHGRAAAHLRLLCRRLQDHPRQPPGRLEGDRHRRRGRHPQQEREIRRNQRLRGGQATLLRPPPHQHEVPLADPRHSDRPGRGALRRRAAGLHGRGPDGAPHRRDPGVRVGRPLHRPDAPRVRARLPGARLSGAAAGALRGRRRQPHVTPRLRRREQTGAVPGGHRETRRADPEARRPAAGAIRAGSDHSPLRARRRRRDHRPLAARAQDRGRQGRAPRTPLPARLGQPRRDHRLHGRREENPRVLDGGAASAAAITPISAAPTPSAASTICWRPAGAPTRRSRGWAGPTARTRPRRRSFVPSPPT